MSNNSSLARFVAIGERRGWCGHRHMTVRQAVACQSSDWQRQLEVNQPSDRVVYATHPDAGTGRTYVCPVSGHRVRYQRLSRQQEIIRRTVLSLEDEGDHVHIEDQDGEAVCGVAVSTGHALMPDDSPSLAAENPDLCPDCYSIWDDHYEPCSDCGGPGSCPESGRCGYCEQRRRFRGMATNPRPAAELHAQYA